MTERQGMQIVLATDGSKDAAAALAMLTSLELRPEDEVSVIVVVPPIPVLGKELEAPRGTDAPSLSDAARVIADDVVAKLRQRGVSARPETRLGNPAEEILTCAEETGADLIVLGAKGVGSVRRFLLGSVAHRVARHASCSVLAVRGEGTLRRVLFATNGSRQSDDAVSAFLSLPLPAGLRATVISVAPPNGDVEAAAAASSAVASRLNQAGIDATPSTASGNEAATIIATAKQEESDLIVVGEGRRLSDGEPVLGPVAFGVLDGAPCSVFIGRPGPRG
ncbi:MAG TPA: universal stress protein [Thermomicrobiales bacterium]